MKSTVEYLYSFSNVSSTLRVIKHLRKNYHSTLKTVAVINLLDRWIVKINLSHTISKKLAQNLRAFCSEMGIFYSPSIKITKVLGQLEAGKCPIEIMNRDRVVIVVYGKPQTEEIEIFRDQIIDRLGYCPQNMA
ncbi:MAG: hypothetical protein ACFCAD_00400 [Pleurocapsa sp.]